MSENKNRIPEKTENAALTDEQLSEAAGGEVGIVIQPMSFKYCAADRTHVYPDIHDACPVCGCKKFTNN